MKVEMLHGGWFTVSAGLWREGDDLEEKVRFPIPAYVVETGEERILVDTGLHPGVAADPAGHYGSPDALALFELEQESSVADQVDLSTITKVILTHLHFDHASGLGLLPSSVPVYVQRREWEAGMDKEAVQRNFFMPADYAPVEDQVELVDGDHDLLGDGSVELLLTPGHTPGHQSVRVGDGLVLGADVTIYATSFDDLRLPVFGDDLEVQKASVAKLREMRDAGALVTPGHDPGVLVPGPMRAGGFEPPTSRV